MDEEYLTCEYSGLPSLAFYLQEQEKLEGQDKDDIVEEVDVKNDKK